MIKIFTNKSDYSEFTNSGSALKTGDIYYVIENGEVHFRTNNIDGIDKVYDIESSSEKDLQWVQAIPNAGYFQMKCVTGLAVGHTYRIHITYDKTGYVVCPYFTFIAKSDNTWNAYSGVQNLMTGEWSEIQVKATTEDFYFDITLPSFFTDDTNYSDYGLCLMSGDDKPDASMEVALLN